MNKRKSQNVEGHSVSEVFKAQNTIKLMSKRNDFDIYIKYSAIKYMKIMN